jgi:predicted peroxiredoxin
MLGEDVRTVPQSPGVWREEILICDLCPEVTEVQEVDLREVVEIVGLALFLVETQDATRTFSF